MNPDDEQYVNDTLKAEDNDGDDELLNRVKRIENGIEEIYKLLKTSNTVKPTDKTCGEHGEAMQSAVSKKTGKPYGFHRNADGQICFGRGYQS